MDDISAGQRAQELFLAAQYRTYWVNRFTLVPRHCNDPHKCIVSVAAGHCDGVVQVFTLAKMHQGKGLRVGGV